MQTGLWSLPATYMWFHWVRSSTSALVLITPYFINRSGHREMRIGISALNHMLAPNDSWMNVTMRDENGNNGV